MLDSGKCRQWKATLQQAGDPGFLMPLVLRVVAKPHFRPFVVMMCDFSESAHFAPELCIPPPSAKARPLCCLALTAGGRSGVSVLVDCFCRDLDVPLLRLQLGQLVVGAHD